MPGLSVIAAGFLWFPWFHDIFTYDVLHVAHASVVLLVILGLAIWYRSRLKSVAEELIPGERVSLKNVIQVSVEALYHLIKGIIPHDTTSYFPLLAAVFIFIFMSNVMGVFPGVLPPTENLNTNYAVAIVVFFYYHIVGLRKVGFKAYMNHFIGPSLGSSIGLILFRLLFMAPLLFCIELISHLMRPFSLSLRLFGNIYGDHQVLATFQELTQGTIFFFIPVVFLAFGIFVSFIQAFVFTLLSSVYVGLAVAHDH